MLKEFTRLVIGEISLQVAQNVKQELNHHGERRDIGFPVERHVYTTVKLIVWRLLPMVADPLLFVRGNITTAAHYVEDVLQTT